MIVTKRTETTDLWDSATMTTGNSQKKLAVFNTTKKPKRYRFFAFFLEVLAYKQSTDSHS